MVDALKAGKPMPKMKGGNVLPIRVCMNRKIPRYLVLHERVVAKFPWTVINSHDGEPALWKNDPKIGRVPMRFRTRELARAAIDQLNARAKRSHETPRTRISGVTGARRSGQWSLLTCTRTMRVRLHRSKRSHVRLLRLRHRHAVPAQAQDAGDRGATAQSMNAYKNGLWRRHDAR